MSTTFTQSFKIRAVEKALSRDKETSIKEVASSLEVGLSTLTTWIRQSRQRELEVSSNDNRLGTTEMTTEKRPQDWRLDERLQMIIDCASLEEEAVNKLCREKGLFAHHVKQWKEDFLSGGLNNSSQSKQSNVKELKQENKALKKELNRKDKALAETAALLVLQKKVNAIWGSSEDNSQ